MKKSFEMTKIFSKLEEFQNARKEFRNARNNLRKGENNSKREV